ncbi:hypothetical protein [Mesorhizobium sp. A556]
MFIRHTLAAAVLSGAALGWMLVNAMAGEISSQVREQALATVALYGTEKADALNCLTHEPAVGIDMRKVFSEDEAHVHTSWLSNGGTAEEWSKFEGSFSLTVETPTDQCPEILDDLYLMRFSGRLLSMRSPFKEMSSRPQF